MWWLTPVWFFSVVRKHDDVAAGTLTVRARVKSDLENLKAHWLPKLGEIKASTSNDYRYRAKAPKAAVAQAMHRAVEALDYSNFKDEVQKRQGGARAEVYGKVWSVLYGLQGTSLYEREVPAPSSAPPAAKKAASIAKAGSYGGVVVDGEGRFLLREPRDHFDGYVWTWPKGRPDPGETPEAAALREGQEETGYTCEITGVLPGTFKGGTGTTAYFLMKPVGEPQAFDAETVAIRWATSVEAEALISLSTNSAGRKRDWKVLAVAHSQVGSTEEPTGE